VRPADTVARFGGGEFVVVCEALDERSALASGQRLQDAVRLPLTVDGVTHHLSASIGIVLGASSADGLLGDADAAAYRAKGNGGGRIVLVR
jgi:diguanylate cyclase (GGDEF)-like protein